MDPHYVYAEKPLSDENNRVLKQGDTFAIFDHYGNIKKEDLGEEGLYHEGTRFLSLYFLRFQETRAMILSSTTKLDNVLLTVDLTNTDIILHDLPHIPRGTLHILRSLFLWNNCLYEKLELKNYSQVSFQSRFILHFESDYADIFEVRGTKRKNKGQLLGQTIEAGKIVQSYHGLDGVLRKTLLTAIPAPDTIRPNELEFALQLDPQETKTFCFSIACEVSPVVTDSVSLENAYMLAENAVAKSISATPRISSSHAQFNDWIIRSESDLHMMLTETPAGRYPYAGVPWFSTPFGRDGIITALECLWFFPEVARGVLNYLATTQATELNPERDAQPGKILHEAREGEMANLGEIPFGRYYGSVDSTPLFILLAGAYFERTGDFAFLSSIWPNIELALKWLDDYGDLDKDGFVEYYRHSTKGLVHQGWKDSEDSVFFEDGTLASGPIALCEVQGYVFAAKRYAEKMARALGKPALAQELHRSSEELRKNFEASFWCEDLGTYALALDGMKRPCRVRTSNPGHCLFSGIVSPQRAQRVADTLLNKDSFCGWGVRTVSRLEKRFNPMSYHNGSVWPHDNAIIASGMSKYKNKLGAIKILTGLFEASRFVSLHRMPELFCGFQKREGEGPTLYPVACAPQSWAGASVFMLLEAALGLHIETLPKQKLVLYNPVLPEFLNEIQVQGLRVGDAQVDLFLKRHREDIGVNIVKREGDVEVIVVK